MKRRTNNDAFTHALFNGKEKDEDGFNKVFKNLITMIIKPSINKTRFRHELYSIQPDKEQLINDCIDNPQQMYGKDKIFSSNSEIGLYMRQFCLSYVDDDTSQFVCRS